MAGEQQGQFNDEEVRRLAIEIIDRRRAVLIALEAYDRQETQPQHSKPAAPGGA